MHIYAANRVGVNMLGGTHSIQANLDTQSEVSGWRSRQKKAYYRVNGKMWWLVVSFPRYHCNTMAKPDFANFKAGYAVCLQTPK